MRPGTRVRLRPRPGGDVFDIALAGRIAVVEDVVESMEGAVQLAVSVEDDPGRDLGQFGHRFFFTPEEVEPLRRILVAGIGNVFLGDDGFGVAVAERLAGVDLAAGVHVEDFGIRGMDLAFALASYDLAILVDAVPRGGAPGTLYVIEPEAIDGHVGLDAHGMDPVKVLGLARALGEPLPEIMVVGCEPAVRMTGDEDEVVAELSAPVHAAVDEAVRTVKTLIDERMETWAR